MGLDMYLYADRYVSGWEHRTDPLYGQLSALLPEFEIMKDEGSPHMTLQVCVAYWRKQNAIHQWFVTNVQEDVDDCKDYYVPREKMTELVEACNAVLSAGEKAVVGAEVLPTQSGFFFGGTDYDDWYEEGLTYTRDRLTQLLALNNEWSFSYRSSW